MRKFLLGSTRRAEILGVFTSQHGGERGFVWFAWSIVFIESGERGPIRWSIKLHNFEAGSGSFEVDNQLGWLLGYLRGMAKELNPKRSEEEKQARKLLRLYS